MYAGELKRSCELVLSHIDEERRMYQQQRVKREQQQRRKKNIELEGWTNFETIYRQTGRTGSPISFRGDQ